MTPPVHADIAVLAPLLGTWEGTGRGDYPTIDAFEYVEAITFTHVGKPFLAYQQRTRHASDGRPLHAEAGYWRAPRPDRAELVIAQPSGITEIDEGTITVEGSRITIDVRSTGIGRTSTAKRVDTAERTFEFDGDTLHYTMQMAAVGQPLLFHLEATLRRQPAG